MKRYPVKYALMPIKQGECETICYIISKCHLVSEITWYGEDGRQKKEYGVVYPYEMFSCDVFTSVVPRFNIYGACINSQIVDNVFDEYEDVLMLADIKNKELCKKRWESLPYSDDLNYKIQKCIDEFEEYVLKYKRLEKKILNGGYDEIDLSNHKVKVLRKQLGNEGYNGN